MSNQPGHPVTCFVPTGATLAASPQEVASKTNLIVTMLPASQHVLEVYAGASGILGYVLSEASLSVTIVIAVT